MKFKICFIKILLTISLKQYAQSTHLFSLIQVEILDAGDPSQLYPIKFVSPNSSQNQKKLPHSEWNEQKSNKEIGITSNLLIELVFSAAECQIFPCHRIPMKINLKIELQEVFSKESFCFSQTILKGCQKNIWKARKISFSWNRQKKAIKIFLLKIF